MRRFLKYLKIVFCNLILIVVLPQFFINSILINVAYAETINFPKATKYTSKEEIDVIWQENYYIPDDNPDTKDNFNQNAMIGVQGWHHVREHEISVYFNRWNPTWDQALFKEKINDQVRTDGGIAYVMDGSDKRYLGSIGQAFGVVGEKIDFTFKSSSSGQEIVIKTVMSNAKGADDWTPEYDWFPEGPYGYYADLWGLNVIEFTAADQVPASGDFSFFGGQGSGPWFLEQVDNYGAFQGFEPRGTRISEEIAWPGMGSASLSDDELDADYVDLDVREFKFSGIPKTVSYEGYTNPIANLFKNLGRLLDLLMGLLINGLKRVIIGWTRIIEIMINYVFFKTEQSMVETPADGEGD